MVSPERAAGVAVPRGWAETGVADETGGTPASHIVGPMPTQDRGGLVRTTFRMDGHDGTACFKLPLIIVRFLLGNPGADQGTDKSGHPGSGPLRSRG